MYQQDYILRLIERVGYAMRRLRRAISEQRPEEGLADVEDAMRALRVDPRLADTLAPERLLLMLSAAGEVDVGRALLFAETMLARADALDALGRGAQAASQRVKAERLAEAVRAGASPADAETAEELLGRLREAAGGESL